MAFIAQFRARSTFALSSLGAFNALSHRRRDPGIDLIQTVRRLSRS
jgi:hypothetical protein